jgi:hypothetical protein
MLSVEKYLCGYNRETVTYFFMSMSVNTSYQTGGIREDVFKAYIDFISHVHPG